jgi:Zn-dependent M28 family amino/carboxypeptidase
VADLNIDMIGRIDKFHEDENYIYLIGSNRLSTKLHEISEECNLKYSGLFLDYKYNAPNDPEQFYYRSDHYNFAKHDVPVIFYFSGTHADYHQPTDDVSKILFPKVERTARLIFHTAWELVNRAERPAVDVKKK